MEILVKKQMVAKMRIVLELSIVAKDGSFVTVSEKDVREASRQFLRDFPEVHHRPRTSRTFHLQIIAVVVMKLLQRFDEQIIHREPHGSTPIRVTAKQSTRRLSRFIVDAMFGAADVQY